MKIKLIIPALLIATLPAIAQAGQATARSMQLSEPLSTEQSQATAPLDSTSNLVEQGSSAAMSAARAKLDATQQTHESNVAATANQLQFAREATS
ncbi:hypothetical protein [Halomonas binhaiensis]|uniref:DUF4148 domain-containing protein n=1 Tax=Halomonas binhaiensis TaxID=2562282 RepID=A0A7U3HWN4_9GAMM|nr:hypothetical protein [Halomonas binhaiensis]QRG26782.1 hypothetical protein E4T21_21530 [Halomonas binhaiensis]